MELVDVHGFNAVEYTQFDDAASRLAGPFAFDNLQSWLLTSRVVSHQEESPSFICFARSFSQWALETGNFGKLSQSHKGHRCLSQVCGNTRLGFVCLFVPFQK